MSNYHFHHPEKMFTDRAELMEIILGQRLLVKARLTKTIVGRVQVLAMTGKRNALELRPPSVSKE